MEEKRTLIIAGVIAVIALILLGGLIYYLVKTFIGSRNNVVTSSPAPSSYVGLPSTGVSPTPQPSSNPNLKTYTGSNFQLSYPSSWGILTCNNSSNFEFDPTNSNSQNVSCDVAQKPITVLVGNSSGCGGTTMQLGNNSVLYSKQTTTDGYIKYEWCTQGGPTVLNITERVSPNGEQATSVRDYSSEVEQMISSLRFGGGS